MYLYYDTKHTTLNYSLYSTHVPILQYCNCYICNCFYLNSLPPNNLFSFFRLQLACPRRINIGSKHNPQTPAITYATVNNAVSELSVSMYSQSTGSEIKGIKPNLEQGTSIKYLHAVNTGSYHITLFVFFI
jgi:hypothetical protein